MQELQLLVITGGDRGMGIIIIISYQSYCVYKVVVSQPYWNGQGCLLCFCSSEKPLLV